MARHADRSRCDGEAGDFSEPMPSAEYFDPIDLTAQAAIANCLGNRHQDDVVDLRFLVRPSTHPSAQIPPAAHNLVAERPVPAPAGCNLAQSGRLFERGGRREQKIHRHSRKIDAGLVVVMATVASSISCSCPSPEHAARDIAELGGSNCGLSLLK